MNKAINYNIRQVGNGYLVQVQTRGKHYHSVEYVYSSFEEMMLALRKREMIKPKTTKKVSKKV